MSPPWAQGPQGPALGMPSKDSLPGTRGSAILSVAGSASSCRFSQTACCCSASRRQHRGFRFSAEELTATMSTRRRDFLPSGRPQAPTVCHPGWHHTAGTPGLPHPRGTPSGREILRTEQLKGTSGTFSLKLSLNVAFSKRAHMCTRVHTLPLSSPTGGWGPTSAGGSVITASLAVLSWPPVSGGGAAPPHTPGWPWPDAASEPRGGTASDWHFGVTQPPG